MSQSYETKNQNATPSNLKSKTFLHEVKNLDWEELLSHLEKSATAAPTKEKLLSLAPKATEEEAMASLLQIEEARSLLKMGIRPFMQSLDLFDSWHRKLKKSSVLSTLEIRDVRHFCSETIALKETLRSLDSAWLKSHFDRLMKADEPLAAIDNVFTLGGEIRSDASETLFHLFREKENLTKQIQQTLDSIVRDYDMDIYLQDKYVTSREGRWVIPVKGGSQHFVKGIKLAQSQSKQTVFIEPEEVIPLNSRLKQVESEIDEEIERILKELSQYLSQRSTDFFVAAEILQELDFTLAQGTLAEHLSAVNPRFSTSQIQLIDLKHPLLALNSDKIVPNTLNLNEAKHILLLTGPNAGGKTVLLKSLGLAAQMARCGMPICASEGSELPFFRKVVTAIGDSQSVDENLSTFAAHLKILDSATHLMGEENLVLVDEICGSTDPEEGSALARSFIETYSKNKIFAILTSHLGPLKTGWSAESEVLQGSLHYDEKLGRPTYSFIPGVAGNSLAIQTAKRVGVSPSLIDRAYELLSPEQRAQRQTFDDLEKLKQDLLLTQKDFHRRAQEADQQKKKYDTLMLEFEKERHHLLDRIAKDTQKELQEKITYAKVDDSFRKIQKLENIKQELPQIIKNKKGDLTESSEPTTIENFSQRFPPGSKVYISTLGQDGIIQGVPNSKGEVPILSNSLRLSLSWKDLRTPEVSSNPTSQILRQKMNIPSSLSNLGSSIDVRGLTVDKAIEKTERDLDQAVLRGEDRVKIVHGHGTESLKRALRAYLSRSPYVKKWKAGTPETGGDGLTWVEIDSHGH